MALIALLATMRDANGDTAIDGITGFDWDGPEFDGGGLPGVGRR